MVSHWLPWDTIFLKGRQCHILITVTMRTLSDVGDGADRYGDVVKS